MEQKQTAVSWLIKQYSKFCDDSQMPFEVLEQAKQMEKEQIINAFVSAEDNQWDGTRHGVHYYQQKYGKDNQPI